MPTTLHADLRADLHTAHAVALVGSAVARHLSADAPTTSWTGLLRHGLDRLVTLGRLVAAHLAPYEALLATNHPTSQHLVAELVSRELGPGERARWLRDALGALTPKAPAIAQALGALGVPLASATPDTLLAAALERPAIPWTDRSGAERWLRGDAPGVLHLLGCWDTPDSVLLGVRALEDAHAQAILQALRTSRTLVLIGCADALRTPALDALWRWARARFAESESRVYLLAQDDQVDALRAGLPKEDRTVVVPYGEREDDLLPFLQSLAPVREPVVIESSADHAATLDRYKRKLTAEAELLNAPFAAPHRRKLSDVYVRLRLRPQAEHELRDQPAEAPLSAYLLGSRRRWVVLGGPGSGKTTSVRQLALRLLDEDGPLPVLLKVPDVCAEGLWGAVEQRYDADIAGMLQQHGELLWMFDGLDEALNPNEAREKMVSLAAELQGHRVVLSSRDADYDPLTGFDDLMIRALDEDQQEELLLCYTTDARRAHRVLTRMRARPRTRDLVETPLLLSLIGTLLRANPDQDPPERRATLYSEAIALALNPSLLDRKRPTLKDEALAGEVLGVLSLALHGEARDRYPMRQVARALQEHKALNEQVREVYGDVDALLRDVAKVTRLVTVRGRARSAQASVHFPHRTYREFFAAEALVAALHDCRLLERDAPAWNAGAALNASHSGRRTAEPVLERILEDSRERPQTWSEVLALTCGLLEGTDADRLIAWLAADGNPRLVARVVAEGEGLSAETVQRALGLESGWGQWETRRDLLLKLPETVGDLGVVVGLVDNVARGTTDGNDLFWARELLRRIARGEVTGEVPRGTTLQDVQARAGVLVEVLLARHRPKEREALRRSLREQDLWKTIPAGDYLVGSPEKEEGRFDDEGPQHPVTLTSPFQILAVPVTWAMYEHFDPRHRAARDDFDGRCPVDRQEQHPVYNVTWYAAATFAEWLGARLPLEAEWEIACRARTTTQYWNGDTEADLAAVGWYAGNSGRHTHPVATPPTDQGAEHPWGLHDLHGNVREWCLDTWVNDYRGRETGVTLDPDVPQMTLQGRDWPEEPANLTARRMVRGGSWNNTARNACSAYRNSRSPRIGVRSQGFRLVLSAAPEP
ncbi:MAG: SUMF1/EgtB/PvdO family nonheme iron enzyme [Alphaproteobacteria bacterium]|nr:SUMF1/EgtB/PvdO family nonheme iron enzyme [Alphaproteobacteria bacterium]